MFEFDAHSRFSTSPGIAGTATSMLEARISDLWNVGPIPNGGYLIALAAKAMASACTHKDPLTVTGHYLRPATPDTASFEVTSIKQGGTFDNAQVSIIQAGTERCRFIAAYGTLETLRGDTWRDAEPPTMPPPEACVKLNNPMAITKRYDTLWDPASLDWTEGRKGEKAEFRAWMRHADGRPNDIYSLLLFADALPPPVFNILGPSGWVPTVELTVHIRAKPAPGFVRCCFRTRFITNGLLEADGELWDSTGSLVALSRQLARIRGQ